MVVELRQDFLSHGLGHLGEPAGIALRVFRLASKVELAVQINLRHESLDFLTQLFQTMLFVIQAPPLTFG